MKTFGTLLFCFVLLVPAMNRLARDQRKRVVRKHQLTLAMSPSDVRRSLGEPKAFSAEGDKESWTYPDGLVVEFARGRVIDSRQLPFTAHEKALATEPRWSPLPGTTDKSPQATGPAWLQPPNGESIQHDANPHAVGGGMNALYAAPTPAPQSTDDRPAWR